MKVIMTGRHSIMVAYCLDEYDEKQAKAAQYEDTIGGDKLVYSFSKVCKCSVFSPNHTWEECGIVAIYSVDAGKPDTAMIKELMMQYEKVLYKYLVKENGNGIQVNEDHRTGRCDHVVKDEQA